MARYVKSRFEFSSFVCLSARRPQMKITKKNHAFYKVAAGEIRRAVVLHRFASRFSHPWRTFFGLTNAMPVCILGASTESRRSIVSGCLVRGVSARKRKRNGLAQSGWYPTGLSFLQCVSCVARSRDVTGMYHLTEIPLPCLEHYEARHRRLDL